MFTFKARDADKMTAPAPHYQSKIVKSTFTTLSFPCGQFLICIMLQNVILACVRARNLIYVCLHERLKKMLAQIMFKSVELQWKLNG